MFLFLHMHILIALLLHDSTVDYEMCCVTIMGAAATANFSQLIAR